MMNIFRWLKPRKPVDRLRHWVKRQHKGQRIKKSGKPYFTHLLAVAEIAAPVTYLGYEIGLCHDLLEDTSITANGLLAALINFNYKPDQASYIVSAVVELTDVYTGDAYPNLDRITRKEMEARRLCSISPAAQTVKFCDLVDNIQWVLQYDGRHAGEYLKKKEALVDCMNSGDPELRQKVIEMIRHELERLKSS